MTTVLETLTKKNVVFEIHDENEKRIQLKNVNKKGEMILVLVTKEERGYTCGTLNLSKMSGWRKFKTELSIDEVIEYVTKNLK